MIDQRATCGHESEPISNHLIVRVLSGATVLFCADITWREGSDAPLKPIVDEAVQTAGVTGRSCGICGQMRVSAETACEIAHKRFRGNVADVAASALSACITVRSSSKA